MKIEGMSPEEYAAMWGYAGTGRPDPEFAWPGDGAMFYNFGSEHQERTPEWLARFRGAIARTIMQVASRPDAFECVESIRGLCDLMHYVRALESDAKKGVRA